MKGANIYWCDFFKKQNTVWACYDLGKTQELWFDQDTEIDFWTFHQSGDLHTDGSRVKIRYSYIANIPIFYPVNLGQCNLWSAK